MDPPPRTPLRTDSQPEPDLIGRDEASRATLRHTRNGTRAIPGRVDIVSSSGVRFPCPVPVPVNETRPESVPGAVFDRGRNRWNSLRYKGFLGSGGGT